jgi:serine O-acetyltransferase
MMLRLLGVNFPVTVPIGTGLQLPHGAVGLVVHERCRIGAAVRLYQGVTLGRADIHLPEAETEDGGGIELADNVTIGAGAVVLFRSGQTLHIGSHAVIGANSVVTVNVPSAEIWAGNPARKVGEVRRPPHSVQDS